MLLYFLMRRVNPDVVTFVALQWKYHDVDFYASCCVKFEKKSLDEYS